MPSVAFLETETEKCDFPFPSFSITDVIKNGSISLCCTGTSTLEVPVCGFRNLLLYCVGCKRNSGDMKFGEKILDIWGQSKISDEILTLTPGSLPRLWLLLFFLAAPQICQAERELIIGLAMPEHVPAMKLVNGMYEIFRDEVHDNAEGEISVEIYYGGMLGNADSRLRQVRAGVIHMSDPAIGNLAPLYPDIQVLSLPYLFRDADDAWAILDGPIGGKIAEGMRQTTGIRALGWFITGDFAHYSSNRPIRSAADLAGKKIRVLSPINAIAVSVHGGSPLPIPFNELYTALRIGVADGADLNLWVMDVLRFYEVQKYLFLDKHRLPLAVMVMNAEFFDNLPLRLQE
ncbi:MAG: TRAP transporter substrate-binding protein, partial [Gammaproteobacteria bacterium]|nr:TRAP transporter substrate-binding protein [Gammaproteobacteria bacterium]